MTGDGRVCEERMQEEMRLVEVAVREERAQAEEKARRENRRGKRRGKRGKKAPPPPHKPEPAMEDTINDEIIALVRYMEAVTAAIAGLSGDTVGGGDNAGGSEAVAASDVADEIETEAEDAQAVQSLTDTVPADGSDGNGAEGAAGPGPAAVLQQPPQLQAETLDGPTLPDTVAAGEGGGGGGGGADAEDAVDAAPPSDSVPPIVDRPDAPAPAPAPASTSTGASTSSNPPPSVASEIIPEIVPPLLPHLCLAEPHNDAPNDAEVDGNGSAVDAGSGSGRSSSSGRSTPTLLGQKSLGKGGSATELFERRASQRVRYGAIPPDYPA